MQKFWQDPTGGRSYDRTLGKIQDGDVIGCGYDFRENSLFFTHNGRKLEKAFSGLYPRGTGDVYAAIGVCGDNELVVNFGAGNELFRWKEGNEESWSLKGRFDNLGGGTGVTGGDFPPSYTSAGASLYA